ncbi:hypothetical protein [Streptomyces sp. NPDC054786]
MPERQDAPSAPELVVESDGNTQAMSPSRVHHVGRDPDSELVMSDTRVSWHHAADLAARSAAAGPDHRPPRPPGHPWAPRRRTP